MELKKGLYQDINEKISLAWDRNVAVRAKDLEEGTDYSYTHIIEPWVLGETLLRTSASSTILDIGCGCGYLTNVIYENGRQFITGIDLSPKSVLYAQKKYPHIKFIQQDICSVSTDERYDLVLAIMVLNNAPDMKVLLHTIAGLLNQNGALILVLPHPAYWPLKHLKVSSFPYLQEKSYYLHFSTKGRKDYPSSISYFHRPIESYLGSAREAGLQLAACKEFEEMTGDNLPEILGMIFKKQTES